MRQEGRKWQNNLILDMCGCIRACVCTILPAALMVERVLKLASLVNTATRDIEKSVIADTAKEGARKMPED